MAKKKTAGYMSPGEQIAGVVFFVVYLLVLPFASDPLFAGLEGRESYLIHTAGIVDISDQVSPLLYDVNVNGTKHILSLCREYQVKRLVYVSSVHAIPEGDKASVLHEVSVFSPDAVVGGYAKTKAEATQAVLDAAPTVTIAGTDYALAGPLYDTQLEDNAMAATALVVIGMNLLFWTRKKKED